MTVFISNLFYTYLFNVNDGPGDDKIFDVRESGRVELG